MLGYRGGFWEEWINPHKCTFDGANRLIFVNPGITELDVQIDIYSDWKEWMRMYDNSKWLPAVSAVGGDPIPGGKTGTTFFLINGWRLVIDLSEVRVRGVLFSQDFDTAYYTSELKAQYPAEVTSVVNTAVTTQNVVTGGIAEIAAAVWATMQAQTLMDDVLFLSKTLKNKREITKIGDVWTLVVYADDDVTPILSKPMKDFAGQNIADLAGGLIAAEEKSHV